MKKCQGCHKEIDKYAIACQYCGKLTEEKKESGAEITKPEEHKQKPEKK